MAIFFLVFAICIGLLIALPLLAVFWQALAQGLVAPWAHLWATVLPELIANSLLLAGGVGLGVAVVGVTTAWLVALHDFPGRRFFEWALLLPMAMPAYVMAYVYTDFLQFVGPLQTFLRETFGWRRGDYWFPEIRSLGGAMAMFVAALYPYVYLIVRTAFLERGLSTFEAARSLGLSPWAAFWRVSLPMARPALAAGVTLALMETLADYGTVAYFAVPTFTTAIYRTWFSLGDRAAAAQLAASLLAFVAVLLVCERASRGRARFHDTGRRRAERRRLSGRKRWLATAACLTPLAVGFILPAFLLVRLVFSGDGDELAARYALLLRNSLLVATIGASLAVVIAVLLGYAQRISSRWLVRFVHRLVSLGYAAPGAVIAVGVLIPVTRLDHWLAARWAEWFGENPGLLLTGGIAALVYAYLARFMGVASGAIDAGFARITPNLEAAAKSLGESGGGVLWRVHLPLLRGSLASAAVLVFVDIMKELPATLVMRPFNFDTLATQTFILASDERLAEAARAALAIVAAGLVPVYLLARQVARGQR